MQKKWLIVFCPYDIMQPNERKTKYQKTKKRVVLAIQLTYEINHKSNTQLTPQRQIMALIGYLFWYSKTIFLLFLLDSFYKTNQIKSIGKYYIFVTFYKRITRTKREQREKGGGDMISSADYLIEVRKAKQKEYLNNWRKLNKDKVREQKKRYNEKHKEQVRKYNTEYMRKYRQRLKEEREK